jgi:outer membrane protein
MIKVRPFFIGVLCLSANAWSASLVELYHEAMASDPRLAMAESEAAVYQALERNRLGGLLPQAQVSAQGSRNMRESENVLTRTESKDYYFGERYSFSVSQPLFNKPSWDAFRSASKEAEEYETRLKEVRGQIALELTDRYTRVLAAEDAYAYASAERKAAQEQLRQVNARYQRKLAKLTDKLFVEARVDMLLSAELDAQNEVALAREAMSELLGREVSEPFAPLAENVYSSMNIGVLDDWLSKALAANHGLQASRLAVRAAEIRVRQASGQRLPSLSLSLTAQRSDIGFENAQVPQNDTYIAALNFNLPLYSGGQVSAQVAEAQARLGMVQSEYDQTERALRKNVREAHLKARSAQQRVNATEKALLSSEKSYEAQKKGFEYGTVTAVDVLDAAKSLFEAKRDNKQAYYDLMVQSLALYQITGEFSGETIVEFDAWLQKTEQGKR